MVQITKLSKEELKDTGFQNKAIASRFLKTVLNKKSKDFKKKDELINTLKKEYNKMKNFGIDLNETSKVERKVNKVKKTAKKSKENFERPTDKTFQKFETFFVLFLFSFLFYDSIHTDPKNLKKKRKKFESRHLPTFSF
jgi:hypothetical protein